MSRQPPWFLVALIAGIAYLLIGRLFAVPHSHVQAWRLAAWLASGVVFASHIAYEQFRLRHTPRSAAFHAAVGVAIGAFGLAVWGAIRSLLATSQFRTTWRLALILWPAFTALPAFLVAWVAGVALRHVARTKTEP